MSFPTLGITQNRPARLMAAAVVIALALTLTAAGCSPAEPTPAPPAGTGGSSAASAVQPATGSDVQPAAPAKAVDPGKYAALSGDIAIDGSSTVFPITEAVAEQFGGLTGGQVRAVVGISGTGGGFKKFCAGEADISNASRPIRQKEVDRCAAAGVEYIELPVAIDGLSVLVNKANDFVDCLSVAQLNTIWAPEAEGVVMRWNQVNPDWPAEEIKLYAPGVDSGTFDYFTEAVNGDGGVSRGDFVASEDDNVLVQGIAGDKYSLGYFGYAYYVENRDKLKAAPVDGGSGCVAPTEVAINDGSYAPLSRPLFIYVRADAAQQAHIAEFVRFYLGAEGRRLAASVGYIPFPGAVYDLALGRFEAGATGTVFGGENAYKGPVGEGLMR